jgi:hypothetical protein
VSWPSWDDWLASRDDETKTRALNLLDAFRACGCTNDPEGWVRSEIDENFAQLARFIFLRLIWEDQLQPWRDPAVLDRIPLAKQLIDAGADRESILQLLSGAVSDAVWRTLTLLDSAWVHESVDDPNLPGWRLMEVDKSTGELTGREVSGLHESLGEVDPEGLDGEGIL